MENHRCFLAVRCPAYYKIIKTIDDISSDLELKINPVDPTLYHFTMHFFGDINERKIDKINTIFSNFTFDDFMVKLQSTGYIPQNKPHKVRILYINADEGYNQLINLSNSVRKILSKGGFSVSKKRFIPHMTAARVKYGKDKPKLITRWENVNFELESFKVENLILLKSELTHSGPIYTELSVLG